MSFWKKKYPTGLTVLNLPKPNNSRSFLYRRNFAKIWHKKLSVNRYSTLQSTRLKGNQSSLNFVLVSSYPTSTTLRSLIINNNTNRTDISLKSSLCLRNTNFSYLQFYLGTMWHSHLLLKQNYYTLFLNFRPEHYSMGSWFSHKSRPVEFWHQLLLSKIKWNFLLISF